MTALALLLASRVVLAQAPEDAIGHYLRGDYAAALPGLRTGADRGDAESQHMLGSMYLLGLAVPQDDRLAAFWYRKAAEQGHANAQYGLGTQYRYGLGIPQDNKLAAFWYRKAAEQGNAGAQASLGSMYATGRGVPKDERLAVFWLTKAAEQGHATGQSRLGYMYANGRGVFQSDRLAVIWYTKAAERGDAVAQLNLGFMYANGRGVPKDDQTAYFWWILASARGNATALENRDLIESQITPEQRAAAQAAARLWRPTPATANATSAPKRDASLEFPDPTSSGTAFRIATDRFVTNYHVVEDCRRVRVDGTVAQIGATDRRMDLALLSAPVGGAIATLRTRRPQIGEAVTVTGFPLQGLLSGFQVTTGTLASLSGLGGDTSQFQISAPVQPGNSGGPVLDPAGHVMGVVVSKLDAIRTARVTGDIPQNVNFAVGGNALRAFLDANEVNYQTSEVDRPLPTTTVAQQAQGFTLRVECWK